MVKVVDWVVQWSAKLNLFIISYSPLALIFSIRVWPEWKVSLVLGLLFCYGVLAAWRLTGKAHRRSKTTVIVQDVKDQGDAVAGYLATYLLPFLGGMPEDAADVLAFMVYFLVAFLVFSKSSLGLINPMLSVMGWRVYSVLIDERSFVVISKKAISSGQSVVGYRTLGDVYVLVFKSE